MSKWDRKAPFNEHGDLMHYPQQSWRDKAPVEWRPVEEFEATLNYDTFTRGRSAAYLILRDREHNRLYPMFLAELDMALPHFNGGVISGTWTITKRGENFGVKLVKATPSPRNEALNRLLQAARAECAQFKFPDEDRPRLWEAVEAINEIDSK